VDKALFERLLKSCPECDSKNGLGFFAGPRGGASQNIMCKDIECRAEFNVTAIAIFRSGFADYSGKASKERYEFFTQFPVWTGLPAVN
jgi:hypothetical protein